MNKPIKQETLNQLRRQTIKAVSKAAKEDKILIRADALAVISQPDFLFINAPVKGIEQLDLSKPVLRETPIMYWQLSGGPFNGANGSFPAGFYTVVATQKTRKSGTISLRDSSGRTVAAGDLLVDAPNLPPVIKQAKAPQISGRITSFKFDIFPPSVKICGEVTIKQGKTTVKVSGCIEAGI